MPWTQLTADICRLLFLFLQGNQEDNLGRAPSASKSGRPRKSRRSKQSRRAKGPTSTVVEKTIVKDSGAPQADK
jgi:hypothetical protein